MSTKNVTQSTNAYNPQSLSTYQNLQGPATGQLSQQITNPQNNSFMQRLRNSGSIASAGFSRGPANGFNPSASSPSNSAAFGRAVAGYGAQTNNALTIGGAQMRNQALSAAMQYRPLQTGGTQVQSTTGLGTWLTPLIGMGMSAAGAAFGMPGLGKGLMQGGGSGGDPVGSQYSGPSMPGYGGSDTPEGYGGSNGGDSVWGMDDNSSSGDSGDF